MPSKEVNDSATPEEAELAIAQKRWLASYKAKLQAVRSLDKAYPHLTDIFGLPLGEFVGMHLFLGEQDEFVANCRIRSSLGDVEVCWATGGNPWSALKELDLRIKSGQFQPDKWAHSSNKKPKST